MLEEKGLLRCGRPHGQGSGRVRASRGATVVGNGPSFIDRLIISLCQIHAGRPRDGRLRLADVLHAILEVLIAHGLRGAVRRAHGITLVVLVTGTIEIDAGNRLIRDRVGQCPSVSLQLRTAVILAGVVYLKSKCLGEAQQSSGRRREDGEPFDPGCPEGNRKTSIGDDLANHDCLLFRRLRANKLKGCVRN